MYLLYIDIRIQTENVIFRNMAKFVSRQNLRLNFHKSIRVLFCKNAEPSVPFKH